MNIYTLIGWVGMILFLVNYFAVSNNKIDPTGKLYNLIQVIAAAAIAISLIPIRAWPTIVLEVFFIGIGLMAISKKNKS